MPSLVSLAEELLAQAKKLDEILEQNNIPPTSFDEDTLELLPHEAQELRCDLLDASHNFRQLVRGARQSGLDITFGWTDQVILRTVWKFKLASAIPIHGSATYDEISVASGLSTSLVVRTIRAAMTLNIFDESEPGRIRHTAISKLLATSEGYYNSVGLQVEDLGPASSKLIEAWETFGGDAGPDQSAFSLYNGGRSLFTVFAEEPERAHRFGSAMKYHVEDKNFNLFNIINAMDWSSLDKPGSRLIDLGGGYGQISQILAKQTQNLTFTVQDLPHVVEQARRDLPAEFSERISFEAHNFMEPQQPEKSSQNTFLISRCLHNWSDYHSSLILRALIPALGKGSKVLIWDSVLGDRPVKKLSDKFELQQDFIMATISNGKDRSAEEFRRVLEMSDGRFRIENIQRPKESKLSMIEVSWNG